MSADCGVARHPDGLKRAAEAIVDLTDDAAGLPDRYIALYEVRNLLRVVRSDCRGRSRGVEESRGVHTRTDVPHTDDRWLGRLVLQGDAPPAPCSVGNTRCTGADMNDFYLPRSICISAVAAALSEDVGLLGDLTSIATVSEDNIGSAVLAARRRACSARRRAPCAGG